MRDPRHLDGCTNGTQYENPHCCCLDCIHRGSFGRNGPNELVVLVLAIALVFIAELVNTAVEAIIDLISPEEHVLARVAKDTAAGAALVAAVFAVVIGILVFYEPVWEWIQSMTS